MSKSNIKILLTLLAVAIVGLVYLYVFKPNTDDAKSIESENETLQARLDDLRAKEKDRDRYVAETKEFYEKFDLILADYPANLDQEISVMFMKGIEDAHPDKFDISSVGLGDPKEFYTISSADVPYVCYASAFPVSYTGTYASIKDVMDYIADYKYRMNIDSVTINYDTENDVASGSINMNAYFIVGGEREKDTVDVDVKEGVDNVFMGGADAASESNKSYAYDADNGASIATNNDVKIALVNANADGEDGITITAGSTKATSAKNDVETVDVKIYTEDDKTYVSYTLDGKTESVEVRSTDVKIYVASSARVDSEDKNGVKLNITNDTDLNVFVKVDGDDAASPRFTKGSTNGVVKVY